MRIVIEIDEAPGAPGTQQQCAAVRVSGGAGTESESGLGAGAARDAGPDASGAPPDLLARAAALGALNAGPAPDLSALSARGAAALAGAAPASDDGAQACRAEATAGGGVTGGVTSAGPARLA